MFRNCFRNLMAKNALCWAFYVINDNIEVGGKVPQNHALHDMSQKVCPFYYKNQFFKNIYIIF